MRNDNQKPLIFLGSNRSMYKFTEVCDYYNIKVAGIIDKDYYGNANSICDIPVINSEEAFERENALSFFKEEYNFFCATNWLPLSDPISIRNKEKRQYLLNVIKKYDLNCISLVDSSAKVSKNSHVGKGVFIDAFVLVEPNVSIGDHTNLYAYTAIGHNTKIGNNCVFQRGCGIAGDCTVEDNVYLATSVMAMKPDVVLSEGTFIKECIYLRRGTIPNEVVSMDGANTRRVSKRLGEIND